MAATSKPRQPRWPKPAAELSRFLKRQRAMARLASLPTVTLYPHGDDESEAPDPPAELVMNIEGWALPEGWALMPGETAAGAMAEYLRSWEGRSFKKRGPKTRTVSNGDGGE